MVRARELEFKLFRGSGSPVDCLMSAGTTKEMQIKAERRGRSTLTSPSFLPSSLPTFSLIGSPRRQPTRKSGKCIFPGQRIGMHLRQKGQMSDT